MSGGTPPVGEAPQPTAAPHEVFVAWLRQAAGVVAEPHVGVLSTVDGDAADGRVLILRDVDARGWWFSSSALSPKGVQLSANSHAALTFYWREQARQVRVRGNVVIGDAATTSRDFIDRSPYARAVAAASPQSATLTDPADYDSAVADALKKVESEPDWVPEHWRCWCLEPDTVEFWQSGASGRHLRWQYRREGTDSWRLTTLWP
ncbi:pyridoxamine 5'-phosphate oxidase [Skermania sp. ID1734]|nr:pyridoxamine 5'-phosphate oxidase [Skermania sp. ID1734]